MSSFENQVPTEHGVHLISILKTDKSKDSSISTSQIIFQWCLSFGKICECNNSYQGSKYVLPNRPSFYLKNVFNIPWRAILILMVIYLCPLVSCDSSAICGLIAATNIQSKTGYSQWSCTTSGITSTDPCSSPWPGLICSNSNIVSINVNNTAIAGNYCCNACICY